MRVHIDQATREQLLEFAQINLNRLNVQPNTGRDKLIDLVRKHWSEDYIEVTETPQPAGPRKTRPHYDTVPAGKMDPLRWAVNDPKVELTIYPTKEKGGSRNVPAHLNAVSYWVPRNRRVLVPLRHFRVLEEAQGLEYPGWDDDRRANGEPVVTQSYTFVVHKYPTDEEIAVWEESMGPALAKQSKERMKRINAVRAKKAA